MNKFEYTIKSYSGFTLSKIVEELNKMGQEGWELIHIIKDEVGRPRYLLKRQIA